ncbi:M48 family metallopeptidase [Desulfocurvus sp. DL9XJH121]
MNTYLIIILGSMFAGFALSAAAALLNIRALAPDVPGDLAGSIDAADYARSQDYARATGRFDLASDTWQLALVTAFILAGGFAWADNAARAAGLGPLGTGLAFFGILFLLSEAASLPLSAWRTFVIEERFGFNRTSAGTFVLDRLKGWLLGIAIGGPLAAMVLWFFHVAGPWAWVLAWAGIAVASVALQYVAPALILPLFNTFTPLPEGELRTALTDYAAREGFALSGLFVIDGSRRSAKSNAFFTGLGRRKRIALFDTLVQAMDTREIVAVAAHEVGHWRCGHILRMTAGALARMGLMLFLMSLFLDNRELFAAFGVRETSVHAGLVFFLLLYTPLSLALGLVEQALSRRYEFQADAFAARSTGDPEALASALGTLARTNLANLTPHPLYVAVHHSHPPVLRRIRALRAAVR